MSKFVTKLIEEIKAKEVVEQLFIQNIGQLDALELQLVGTTYKGEFIGLITFIQHIANGGSREKVKISKRK